MTSHPHAGGHDRLARLWTRYKRGGDRGAGNLLLEAYLPMVRSHAEGFARKLPDEVDVDDLASAGISGLLDAIDAFDPERGIKFEKFGQWTGSRDWSDLDRRS